MSSAQTVRFINKKYTDQTLIFREEVPALYDPSGTRQISQRKPPKLIKFEKNVYETSDPEEIEFIRNHPHFTGFNADTGTPEKQCIIETQPPSVLNAAIANLAKTMGEENLLKALESVAKGEIAETEVQEADAAPETPKRGRKPKKAADDFLFDDED